MKNNVRMTAEEAREKTLYRILAQIAIRRALKRREEAAITAKQA